MAKSITLRNIPPDVFKILLQEQGRVKSEKSLGQFGLEQTIYNIVRESERCKKANQEKK